MQTRVQANTLTWTQTQTWTETSDLLGLQARSGQGPRSDATLNLVPNNQANGVPHETNNTQQQPPATLARKGCRTTWLLLDHLQAEIARFRCETLECGGNELSNELSGYDRSATLSDKVWENVNPGLDRILGFGRRHKEIVAMVCCSWVGLQGLYEYLEVLIEEGGIAGGLLEGKVTALITALENGTLQGKGEEMQRAGVYMKQD
ncbi:hypothetical protein EDB84DRAFT_1442868 [Lactarius hengduanensis]|nr:hypothetical protein EDB84DRAFT_1442868 [Lactarius hengduanensis]